MFVKQLAMMMKLGWQPHSRAARLQVLMFVGITQGGHYQEWGPSSPVFHTNHEKRRIIPHDGFPLLQYMM